MATSKDFVFAKGVEAGDQTFPKPEKAWGIRHLQVALMFFALVIAYGIRVNISVAVVAMTTNTTEFADFPTFDWDRKTQDLILSSFFWGYIILQIPAGVLAARFGSKNLLALSFVINAAVAILTPMAAIQGGWKFVCGCRVLQGLGQGFLYPSIHGLIGLWIPPEERGRMSTYVYAGAQLGTVVELMLAGVLGASSWGWPSIFYTVGSLGIVWAVFWMWLGADSPASSRHITEEERNYIQHSLGHGEGHVKHPTPWGGLFTSLPFWALIIVHCGQNWGFWTLLTEMPTYMNKVLNVDIKSNGVFSALPYFGMYLLSFVFSNISDYVVNSNKVSLTLARKISNTIGFWGPAIFLIVLSYVPAGNVALAVTFLTITVSMNAGYYVGFQVVHIDMAPNFASTMMGITNCFSNVISIIAPLSVGHILADDTLASEWRKVFFVASAIYFLSNLFFILFGTSRRQLWNEPAEVRERTVTVNATYKKNSQEDIL